MNVIEVVAQKSRKNPKFLTWNSHDFRKHIFQDGFSSVL